MPDAHNNFAHSLVATAPSPAASGTSLVVTSGHGTRFPAVPFNAIICPVGATPTPENAEIVRVTAIATDTLTITRTQEGTSARTVVVGDGIFAGPTVKAFTDLQGTKTLCRWEATQGQPPATNYGSFITRNSRALMEFDDTTDESLLFYGIIPEGAVLTSGIRRIVRWKGKTATSGNIQDAGAFERGNTDSDADSFATAVNSAATAINGTSGITTVVTTDHSSSEIDGITAGDDFYLKITRLASGSDTVTGDLQLVSVEIQQIA